LLDGGDLLGPSLAVGLDWALWTAGTLTGLASAAVVPCRMATRARLRGTRPFGGWLMPVVPPMVSASAGALLVPHTPAGQPRLTMLAACCAMFGLSLIASAVMIALIVREFFASGPGEARLVPTLFIVLGPLGQSITAANLLAAAAPSPYRGTLQLLAVGYGIATLGFALLWAAIAAAVALRTVRDGLPFALTWWSFTFPVGTCVTGTSALAAHTGVHALRDLAVAGFAALVCAVVTVAVRTARGIVDGRLVGAPAPVGRASQLPLVASGSHVPVGQCGGSSASALRQASRLLRSSAD
jgi:tellurite resistance protein TehA-like permease